MSDLLMTLINPSIVVLCCVIGAIIKHLFDKIDNRYIPVIVACSGVVLACLAGQSVTIENVAQGIISGWASTGVHQTFKNLRGGSNDDGRG